MSEIQNDKQYPNTLRAQEAASASGRPRVFDPALRHFAYGFQLGDYVSDSTHERLEWELVRAEVRTHLLHLVAGSRWREHLVLRGSVLMQAWFGEQARDPKDIDWVFQPPIVKPSDALAQECLSELVELARQHPRTPNAEIVLSRIAQDEIWTYERAEGRRLIFPFQTPGGRAREIQMDIVWNEPLPEPPVLTTLPTKEENNVDGELRLWAATPALSLAWKLLWLAGDAYPQGKDLYDAVLLAERLHAAGTPLSFDLLRRTFDTDEWWNGRELTLDTCLRPHNYDWKEFRLAFPWISVEVEDWERRLRTALAPTFIEGTISTTLERVQGAAPLCLPPPANP